MKNKIAEEINNADCDFDSNQCPMVCNANELARDILSTTDDRWYVETFRCSKCKGFGDMRCRKCMAKNTHLCSSECEFDKNKRQECPDCKGVGKIKKDATIQEILDGNAKRRG